MQLTGRGQPAFVFETAFSGRPGDLDRAFGVGGKVVTDLGQIEGIEDLAVQADGKIVAVGTTWNRITNASHFVVVRYTGRGSLDAGFGAGGKVTTEFGGTASGAYAAAVQRDGKIIAAGAAGGGPTGSDIALARYNADGSLDTSFGVGGKVVTDFNLTHESALGLAIQPDGRLVVVGYTRPFGTLRTGALDFALARYNPNGTLDTSFDGDGKVSTGFTPGFADFGWDVALTPDGKIVAAGWAIPAASGPSVIDVARYNPDGGLDASFDGDGRVISAPSSDNAAFGVVVQPNGQVVVAGSLFSARPNLALVRYTRGGSLDSTFGVGGVATADYDLRFAGAQDLVRQRDGKLVAVGSQASSYSDLSTVAFAAARFESSGKPDRSFHGGAISTDFGAWDEARAVVLQADGKIVAGGFSARIESGGTITAQDFALARYLGAAPCKVPNVRGKKLAVARSAITRARCRVGKVRRKESTSVKPGRVISQSPNAGERLPNRGKVNLVVSKGRRR